MVGAVISTWKGLTDREAFSLVTEIDEIALQFAEATAMPRALVRENGTAAADLGRVCQGVMLEAFAEASERIIEQLQKLGHYGHDGESTQPKEA